MRRIIGLAVALAGVALACGNGGSGPGVPTPATGAPVERRGDLRLVSLNVLHGDACAAPTDRCHLDDRLAVLFQQLEAAACPDVVALQEVNEEIFETVRAARPAVCRGAYELVWHGQPSHDTELVLTTLPVVSDDLIDLAGEERTAYRVELESTLGSIFLVVTHLGASNQSDGRGGVTCRVEAQCPLDLCPSGTFMVTCQVRQIQEIMDDAPASAISLVVGDFNLTPAAPQMQDLLAAGFVDAYLEAGNPECDRATGVGCTSGRADSDLSDLRDPTSRQQERIDYVLVRVPSDCAAAFDAAADPDRDGLGTGLFADGEPAVAGPGGIVYPSDHTGVAVDLGCGKVRA